MSLDLMNSEKVRKYVTPAGGGSPELIEITGFPSPAFAEGRLHGNDKKEGILTFYETIRFKYWYNFSLLKTLGKTHGFRDQVAE